MGQVRSSAEEMPKSSSPEDQTEWAAILPENREVTFRGLRASHTSWRKLLFEALWRWFIASLLLSMICVVLTVYSSKEVLDKPSKRVFNTIVTGLSMILSLVVMEGLEKAARDVRWWILSRRPRSRQKVERILRAESMLEVLKLAIRSRRWSIHLTALLWVSLLLSAQAAIASLGLLYSLEKANKIALFSPGNVSIPDLSHITTDKVVKSPTSQMSGQQYAANSYGVISQAWTASTEDNIPKPGQLWGSDDPLIFCGSARCQYIFHEISTASLDAKGELSIVVTTKRSVSATSSCISWPVIEGGKGRDDRIVIRTNDGNQTLPLPAKAGVDQTTFMTNVTTNCGDGCSTVTALEASDNNPWYYSCNVTVSDATETSRPEHHVATGLRQLAAASIALQGYDSFSFINDTSVQYRIYPAESIFGFPANGSVDVFAASLNQFAAGTIAVAAEGNSKLVVFGDAPRLGVKLQVEHWGFIAMIFIFVAGGQLILGFVAAFLASRVVMPQGGTVAEAQVVRAMGPDWASFRSGNGKQAAESKEYWIYRAKEVQPGTYDLFMEEVSKRPPYAMSIEE